VTCAGLLVAMSAGLSAQKQQPTEARVQELIRLAAERVAAAPQTGATPTAQSAPAAEDSRAVVSLTLDQVVKLALDRNLDISVQRLNPSTYDYQIANIRATYGTTFTTQLATQTQTSASTSTVQGNSAGSAITQNIKNWNGGVTHNMPWGGGAFSATLNNSRNQSTSLTSLYNPQFTPNWSAQYTQPLIRGFRTDSTRQQLVVTKISQDVSEVQLQATIINTLSNVQNAYWDYVFSVQSVEVGKQSVALAERLVQDNETRVQVGTMAPLDVVQARSQAATARQTLVAAQSTMRTNELALKRLIVAGTEDPNWGVRLDPIDRPAFNPQPVDVEGAVRRALSARTDIAITKKNLESNDITMKFLKDQTLPAVDAVFRYQLTGLGGKQLLTSGSGITREVIGSIPGGYSDALGTLFDRNYPTWNFTINFSYPLGMSTAETAVRRARITQQQVKAQVKQIELQVATEVTNAAVTVQNNSQRVQAAQAARELAQQQLDAENSKFEVGMSTNYLVVQSQRDLATAQNNELQSVLNYRKSLVEFQRLQQTTLQNLNISGLSSSGLNSTSVGSGRPTVVAGGS